MGIVILADSLGLFSLLLDFFYNHIKLPRLTFWEAILPAMFTSLPAHMVPKLSRMTARRVDVVSYYNARMSVKMFMKYGA